MAPRTWAGTPSTFPTRSAGIWPASGKAEAACPTEVRCTGRRGGPCTSLSPSGDLDLLLELGVQRSVRSLSPRLRMEKREGRRRGTPCPWAGRSVASGGRSPHKFPPCVCTRSGQTRGPEPHFVPPVAGVGAERFPRAAVVIFQQRKGPHPHFQESVTVDCLCFATQVASQRPFLEVFPIRERAELGGHPLLRAQRGQARPGDPGNTSWGPRGRHARVRGSRHAGFCSAPSARGATSARDVWGWPRQRRPRRRGPSRRAVTAPAPAPRPQRRKSRRRDASLNPQTLLGFEAAKPGSHSRRRCGPPSDGRGSPAAGSPWPRGPHPPPGPLARPQRAEVARPARSTTCESGGAGAAGEGGREAGRGREGSRGAGPALEGMPIKASTSNCV